MGFRLHDSSGEGRRRQAGGGIWRPPRVVRGRASQGAPPIRPAPWFNRRGVELANLAGDTVDDVIRAAERGIQRIRGRNRSPLGFLRHWGVSLRRGSQASATSAGVAPWRRATATSAPAASARLPAPKGNHGRDAMPSRWQCCSSTPSQPGRPGCSGSVPRRPARSSVPPTLGPPHLGEAQVADLAPLSTSASTPSCSVTSASASSLAYLACHRWGRP
jgi:hypothetical protein